MSSNASLYAPTLIAWPLPCSECEVGQRDCTSKTAWSRNWLGMEWVKDESAFVDKDCVFAHNCMDLLMLQRLVWLPW